MLLRNLDNTVNLSLQQMLARPLTSTAQNDDQLMSLSFLTSSRDFHKS